MFSELLNALLQTGIAFGVYIAAAVAYNLVGFAKKKNTVQSLADIKYKWKTAIFWEGVLDEFIFGFAALIFAAVLQIIFHQTDKSIDLGFITLNKWTMTYMLYAGTTYLVGKGIYNFAKTMNIPEDELTKLVAAAEDNNYAKTIEKMAEEVKDFFAPAIEVPPEDIAKDTPVVMEEVEGLGYAGDVLSMLKDKVGQYLMEESGKYRGQCPQINMEMRKILGVSAAAMGNGRDVVDNLVKAGLAVYCGNEAGAIWSTKNGEYGHTGVSLGGDYVLEQNVNYGGLPARNFGVGNTYPVRIGRWSESWRNKAGLVYCRLNAYLPTPVPSPAEDTPAPIPEPKPAVEPPVAPQTVPNNPTLTADIKVGESVWAWGIGSADSYGKGSDTKAFGRTKMKVLGMNNGRYALNQWNSGTIGRVADITGWFTREQIEKIGE